MFSSDEYKDEEQEEDYFPFIKVLEEAGATTAEGLCAEIITNTDHPRERYVITIV